MVEERRGATDIVFSYVTLAGVVLGGVLAWGDKLDELGRNSLMSLMALFLLGCWMIIFQRVMAYNRYSSIVYRMSSALGLYQERVVDIQNGTTASIFPPYAWEPFPVWYVATLYVVSACVAGTALVVVYTRANDADLDVAIVSGDIMGDIVTDNVVRLDPD